MSDNDELKGACFDLARTAKWAQKPIDAELLSSLAEKLEKIARGFLSEPLERDIPLMVKAIRYLNHVHAMPPMDDDTMWFPAVPLGIFRIGDFVQRITFDSI